jgi:6-pyruvoyltetrahydropterin/6-carboxytetrahydropterin synthase
MITVTKKYEFSAAHMLEGHSKCGHLHGHNYVVTVEVDLEQEQDSQQMVLDCVLLDSVVQPVLDRLAGKFLISTENIRMKNPYINIAVDRSDGWVLGVPTTSPEHLAEYIATNIGELIFGDVTVTVHDTNNSSATYWVGGNV